MTTTNWQDPGPVARYCTGCGGQIVEQPTEGEENDE